MGDIPEPRTKIWISRERKISLAPYESTMVSAGVQGAFEVMATGAEIYNWQLEMEKVVEACLDRQEAAERKRKEPKPAVQEKPLTEQEQVDADYDEADAEFDAKLVHEEVKVVEQKPIQSVTPTPESVKSEAEQKGWKKCIDCGKMSGFHPRCVTCWQKWMDAQKAMKPKQG